MILIKYDLETKKNCTKLCEESELEKIVGYVKFLNATNIEGYLVDFEKEMIARLK